MSPETSAFPAKSWRSAWRSIRLKEARNDEGEVIYPGIEGVRFHDLRHTAVTVMAEADYRIK